MKGGKTIITKRSYNLSLLVKNEERGTEKGEKKNGSPDLLTLSRRLSLFFKRKIKKIPSILSPSFLLTSSKEAKCTLALFSENLANPFWFSSPSYPAEERPTLFSSLLAAFIAKVTCLHHSFFVKLLFLAERQQVGRPFRPARRRCFCRLARWWDWSAGRSLLWKGKPRGFWTCSLSWCAEAEGSWSRHSTGKQATG